ncbi:MAG TPA: hypothetical protein VN043_03410 [Rhodanobacter sp.]|nr:hypothetical protein [Rhodanobacter sp.]
MRTTSSHLLLCFGLLLGMLWAPLARADVLLTAKSIQLQGVDLQKVSVKLGEDSTAGIMLQLHAAQADLPALGWRHVGLNMDGKLLRDDRMRWIFNGKLSLAGAAGGALSGALVKITVSEAANTLLIDVLQGKASINAAFPLDQTSHAQIHLQDLPAGWLQGLLGTIWSGRPTGGRLDAELALDLGDTGVRASGQFTLAGVGFDTPSGTLAGQAVDGSGRFNLDSNNVPTQLDLDASLRGGELLLGSLYAKLPDHPVQLDLHAAVRSGAVTLSRLRLNDPDAVQLDGAMVFDAAGTLKSLRLDRLHASFPAAYERYGKAWLNTLGLRDMRINGQLSGSMDLRVDGLRRFAFTTDALDLADADGRVAINGLQGGLDWAALDERPATTLSWNKLQFYRIDSGAAKSRWQSRAGTLSLQQPLEMPVLGGRLHVSQLDWNPAAEKGQRLATSLALTGIDMAAFSQAVGWPAFPGTLGGAVPSLRWVDDRIELDGGLTASVFGGFVDITQLSLQQPFGPSPVLSGNIALNQLDLAAMTSVFDFGSITGRLDGSINDLRLVNWSPVAFHARLLAGGGGRISQRAVNNLTSVGGGGIAAGLQGAVLKLFKTFGYKQIGLNCTLQGTVCSMSGLENTGDGYTILEGSGLPRLQVIGHQTRVDWPTLVKRLDDAIHGASPQVR